MCDEGLLVKVGYGIYRAAESGHSPTSVSRPKNAFHRRLHTNGPAARFGTNKTFADSTSPKSNIVTTKREVKMV
ncbi:hypothetical protein MES4922_300056 [Mesorhizobium ventifaucium]|uniref:Uncharacterized protein n=1 Tax=Mesorhizobium ventifaucium TaxID=666020 RepID=A0ABN8JXQ3_9HYPH|nr:hypothetical protein MES4922_300056 [Mesorhizobium ventifaucium]